MQGFLHDFELLAVRYGLRRVMNALRELRIKPGQRFFPQPSEVAEEIEDMMTKERAKFLKENPLPSCSVCRNLRFIETTREGERAMARCQCWITWKRNAAPIADTKLRAANS